MPDAPVDTDDVHVTSAHGTEKVLPVFVADLEFDGIAFPTVPVVGDEDYPIALIGRDLLNDPDSIFEGPARRFAVTRP
jgi:hypothetical protein